MKLLFLILLSTLYLFASVGKISALNGNVIIDRENKQLSADIGTLLEEKDIISTGDKSKVQILMNDGTVFTIGKNAKLNISEYFFDEKNPQESKADFKFIEGAFKSITGAIGKIVPDRFKLETKSATIGIRGTIIVGNQEKIACTYGQITVTAFGVTQIIDAGMMTNTKFGKPPTPPIKLDENLLKEIDNFEAKEDSKLITDETLDIDSNLLNKISNQISENKIQEKIAIENSKVVVNIPFYSASIEVTNKNGGIGSKTFNVENEGTTITIATHALSNTGGYSYNKISGFDPLIILLKYDETTKKYKSISQGNNDDSWTMADSYNNAILNLTLQKGSYKILVADYPFSDSEAIGATNREKSDEAIVKLYFTSTTDITFDDTDFEKYSYVPKSNNLAFINSSTLKIDKIEDNNAKFGVLVDSKIGTSMYINNYGYFVTISDSFINQNDCTNCQNVFLESEKSIEEIDGSSWGYWTNSLQNSEPKDNPINLKSVWVSGNRVIPADNYQASFKGQVIGSVNHNGNSGYIVLNQLNSFKATLDIGSAKITDSYIGFNDSKGGIWLGTFDTFGIANINTSGFSSNIIGTLMLGDTNTKTEGTLSGKYYGTTNLDNVSSVKSIGGTFNMSNGISNANGVFKARLQ